MSTHKICLVLNKKNINDFIADMPYVELRYAVRSVGLCLLHMYKAFE